MSVSWAATSDHHEYLLFTCELDYNTMKCNSFSKTGSQWTNKQQNPEVLMYTFCHLENIFPETKAFVFTAVFLYLLLK